MVNHQTCPNGCVCTQMHEHVHILHDMIDHVRKHQCDVAALPSEYTNRIAEKRDHLNVLYKIACSTVPA